MYVNTALQSSLTKQQIDVCCICNSLNIKEQKVSNKMFSWMLFRYFCKLTIRVKQDKQNMKNFWKTSIRILFVRLRWNLSIKKMFQLLEHWAFSELQPIIWPMVKACGHGGVKFSWGSGAAVNSPFTESPRESSSGGI